MISAHHPVDEEASGQLTNKVIKILSAYGSLYKTFGENIILLINREGTSQTPSFAEVATNITKAETSLQLLTLKLLYLIFTTPSTYEYFFTNDLHVLVDILIRNLLDLPEEAAALRHTYLRVLYPLLAHTQLRQPPHYKRHELRRLMNILVPGQVSYGSESQQAKMLHFEEVDDTTRRLVARCATVEWLKDPEQPDQVPNQDTPTQAVTATIDTVLDQNVQESPIDIGESLHVTRTMSRDSSIPDSPGTASPTRMDSMDSRCSSEAPLSRRLSAVQRLGMHEPASASTLSVQAVASLHEKPGIMTPSRKDGPATNNLSGDTPIIRIPKIRPEPPKARRWRGRRMATDDEDQQHSAGTSSDRNVIPEGIEVSPTSTHTAPTPSPTTASSRAPPGERRNSTTTSHLVPPVPAHSRRSASNPPPAVPPPRRSAPTTPSSSHHRPVAATGTSPGPGKHGEKPLPPKTRRWGRGKQHSQTDSIESGTSSGSLTRENEAEAVAMSTLPPTQQPQSPDDGALSDPFSPTSPTSPTLLVPHSEQPEGSNAPLSVEEAVQNVSLH
jgi:hypothetical protein